MALSEFQIAYHKALTGHEPEPAPVVEPEPTVEPWTAEEANQHTREIEDEHFQIYAPTNNQRRVLYADTRYGGDCSL